MILCMGSMPKTGVKYIHLYIGHRHFLCVFVVYCCVGDEYVLAIGVISVYVEKESERAREKETFASSAGLWGWSRVPEEQHVRSGRRRRHRRRRRRYCHHHRWRCCRCNT